MFNELDEFLEDLDQDSLKELLDCLIIYNNTIEDIFTDSSVHICLYTSYIDSIKATLVYNESIATRNRNGYFYSLYLIFYSFVGFIVGYRVMK